MKPPRALVVWAIAASVTATAGCAAKARERPLSTSRIDTGPGTTTSARKFLEGRWSLVSFEVHPPGGQPIMVAGAGTMSFDDFSNLDMQIRVDEATAAGLARAGIVTQQGVLASSGRVVLDMPAQKLTYILEGQPAVGAPSGPLAMNRPRYWQVDGDVLTLTTRDDAGNPLSVAKWKRQPQ